ncbi:MAG: glutamine synthetase [Deferribacteres bacterium]|nr:glutamine synthetase [candidate division KSB1 bacterium]MCB9502006.1 glutamine synthetase [Deferribacteres bacterium]
MLTKGELSTLVQENQIETVLVVFTDHYGRFMGKRYDAEFFISSAAKHGAHSCDYLLTVDMEMNPVPGYKFANWELGYGDFKLVPDFKTLRVANWLDKSALVLCDIVDEKSGERITIAPRSILRRQIEKAESLNYSANAGSELEYYIFEDSYKNAAEKGHTGLAPFGWYIEDYHMLQGSRTEALHGAVRKHLKYSGIPVETSKGEWGVGQHEINLRYADILTMADRHNIYKQCLKEVADQQGLSVTFMAKVAADQAGSSCHLHVSLLQEGENIFQGNNHIGDLQVSDEFRWFLGGWMAHVPELMVFYAPTVNSYKRYQSASWAPTRLAWSHDNRTAGFRIVGSEKSLRIECRIPGADCNPYLAFAAALASGLDGIENKTEPPALFTGDVYAAEHVPEVPKTLNHAIGLFANSEFARSVFGDDVVDHYSHFFRMEQQAFDNAVTDWERKRYFERI